MFAVLVLLLFIQLLAASGVIPNGHTDTETVYVGGQPSSSSTGGVDTDPPPSASSSSAAAASSSSSSAARSSSAAASSSSSSSTASGSSVTPFIVFPAQTDLVNIRDGWQPTSMDAGAVTFVSDSTRGNVANFASADFFTSYAIPSSYSVCLWFTVGATKNFAWAFVAFGSLDETNNAAFYVGIGVPTSTSGTLVQKRTQNGTLGTFHETDYVVPTFALNTWYHVCYTWDTTTKVASTYLNGAKVTTNTFLDDVWTGAGSTLRIGAGVGVGYPYTGLIQGLAIWDASINDQQVARIYSQQNGMNQVSQLAQYL